MIRRITIRGYKSLQDVDLRLDPLTIVIGPNAAGKSNLLDAIGLLSRTVSGDLPSAFTGHRGEPLRSFTFDERGIEGLMERRTASFHIEVDIELSESTVDQVNRTITEAREGREPARALVRERFLRYSVHVQIRTDSGLLQVVDESLLALNGDLEMNRRRKPFLSSVESRSGQERLSLRLERQSHPFEYDLGMDRTVVSLPHYAPHHPHVVALRHELASWRTYYLEPDAMRRDSSLREVKRLPHDGSDLSGFYNTMETEYPQVFDAMNRALRGVLPSIEHVGVSPTDSGRLRLYIVERGVRFEASALSEGTLRILALIGITNSPTPASVIGYEEPENGVHPARLPWIASLLEEASRNGRTQFIINTHSAQLPGMFSPEESLVLRCYRNTAGVTGFGKIDRRPMFEENEIKTALDENQEIPASPLATRIQRGDFV
jgi:predicted ATPase